MKITSNTYFYLEPEAYEGVRRIAGKVALDVEAVTGVKPEISQQLRPGQAIVCATFGKSPLASRLAEAGALRDLTGKREVYQLVLTELEGIPALVICGSDKRGTIYGLFALSEYIGVSPRPTFPSLWIFRSTPPARSTLIPCSLTQAGSWG